MRRFFLFVALTLATLAWGDETYYLQGISGSAGTSTLTGDFFTTAPCSQTVSVSYDGVDYTKAVAFNGNGNSWSSMSYTDRILRYDCKTDETEFIIIAYNKKNSVKQLYIGKIIEGSLGSENTATLAPYDISATSTIEQSYTIASATPASLYVSAGDKSNVFVVQIVAIEKGTPHKKAPGENEYQVNFNKHRLSARNNEETWLDNQNLKFCVKGTHTPATDAQITLNTKGTHYIQFTNPKATKITLAVSGNAKGFWIAKDKDATVAPSALQNSGAKNYELILAAGTYFIVPNSGDVKITSIQFETIPTYSVTFEKNGHGDESVTNLTEQITLPTPLPSLTEGGWTFKGWYYESTFDHKAVAGDTLTSNTTLYAKWIEFHQTGLTLIAEGADNAYTTAATATFGEEMPSLAVLPTKAGFEFAGYYNGVGGTGKRYYTSSGHSACEWDKTSTSATLYAKWNYPSYTYILGSCYIKNGLWTQGSNGIFNAWRYIEEDGVPNLISTDDISFAEDDLSGTDFFYNTTDLSKINDLGYWSTSGSSDRAIKGFKLKNETIEFDLHTLQANKISFYSYTTGAAEETVTYHTDAETKEHPVNTVEKYREVLEDYEPYTGIISITARSKEQRFVVVVNVPPVSVSYDANGGIGTMDTQLTPRGAKFTLNPNEFSKPGVVFGGWTEDAAGLGTVIPDVATITPSDDITLYAKWLEPCDATPILRPVADEFTIWNGKDVDMTLLRMICKYDTTTVKYSLKSVSESITGCTFKFYNAQIHLVGTTTGYSTSVTKDITFIFNNNCIPEATFSITIPIQINPTSQKPKIAFIVTGTEKKNEANFTDFSASDRDNCNALLTYLSTFYDITCVNGYATKDEAILAAYYAQYDLLIVTDFLDTGKGYTNAIGTLIDKKPILSFEAYVAGKNGSNWHIGSNPVDPSPKVKDMKVLCAGHSVFGGGVLEPDGETVKVLSSISGKGLQGFVINEAPDFLFLATIQDGNGGKPRDLIVCCERQMVFPARLMMYCINHDEMGNLTDNGKLAMKQMIDYLLLTDETKVADCALVFDNGAGNTTYDEATYHAAGGTGTKGDGKWSTAANWSPSYSIVPSAYHPTRIIAPCEVDIENAHASSVKINVGKDHLDNVLNGKITVLPQGGLVVAGFINKVNDTRYANLLETTSEDIIIQANEEHNGALVFGNKETEVRATVEYYSRGEKSGTSTPVWQYMGIPVQAEKTAIAMYYEAWMCRWAENSGLGGLWQWVRNEDILIPFEGYCITQAYKKTYTLSGKLNAPVSHVLKLDVRDGDGYAFAANSWTAPIKVKEMADDDFNNAEKTIYIYHTGSYDNYVDNGTPVDATTGKATLSGQYAVVPIHAAKYIAEADSVIPAMQGFFVKTLGAGARLELVYNRVVYDAKYFKTTASPMRAPKQGTAKDETPSIMHVFVGGEHGMDQIYLLSRNDFSNQFEDGWDGRKIEGDTALVPTLAVIKEAGNMAVAAIPSLDERELSFRAGIDTEYTFNFNYDGETIYLYDRLADEAVEIKTGNTYSFTADNKTAAKRFLITKNPPRMPTGIGDITVTNLSDAEKCIIDGQLYIIKDNRFYDARGVRVTSFKRKEIAP